MKATLHNLRFECPNCDQTIDAEPELAGTKGKCPHCKARIIVPRLCEECGEMMTLAGKKCRSCVALASGNAGVDGLQMTVGIGFAVLIAILTGAWWVLWLVWGAIGAKMGESKGCPRWGAFLGFILGPIGLMLIHYEIGLRGLVATLVILGAIGMFTLGMVKEQERKRRKDEAREDAAHQTKMAALDRESEDKARAHLAADEQRREADELARQTRIWERLPKWDRYGLPINRVPPAQR